MFLTKIYEIGIEPTTTPILDEYAYQHATTYLSINADPQICFYIYK